MSDEGHSVMREEDMGSKKERVSWRLTQHGLRGFV
jgi:hypothetical protein